MIQKSKISEILELLPASPGVYRFLDKNATIIYIGKAKNLKKRVVSYFTKIHSDSKTNILVKKIESIEFIVLNSEWDALLLENNLIKEHQPRYNILLRDDKSYPWICVTNEMFPKIFKTRNKINDGSRFFGPYSSGIFLKTLQDLIKEMFKLRTCNYNFTEEKIRMKKYSTCLEYHLGNCLAPCIGLQSEENYMENIGHIIKFLKGDYKTLRNILINKMNNFSDSLQFEEAHNVKKVLQILEGFYSRTVIVSPKLSDIDVFSYSASGNNAFINYLKVTDGAIVQSHNLSIKKQIDESDSDCLLYAVVNTRQMFSSSSKKIILPFKPDFSIPGTFFIIPSKGDKKKLLELSENNVMFYKHNWKLRQLKANYGKINIKLLENVKETLRLKELPVHIECFDNSNIQGSHQVSACVVFKNGRPLKSGYRHYNIKSTAKQDDFASMYEVISRRYSRLIAENKSLPQLIVIDGGKGQLSSALSALKKLGLDNKVEIISIAKKLEEIYSPSDPLPLLIGKRSETLKLIQRLRDEAHRFGISFHRNKRSGAFLTSELLVIPGIGQKTFETLMQFYKSIDNLKSASFSSLQNLIGKSKAEIITSYLSQ